MAAAHFTAVLLHALKALLLLQAQHQPSYHLVGSAFIYWGRGRVIDILLGWQLMLAEHSENIKENIFPSEIKSCALSKKKHPDTKSFILVNLKIKVIDIKL